LAIRVLTISKPYVARVQREKFKYLAQDPRFEIGLIAPTSWGSQKFEPDPSSQPSPYWLKVLPIYFTGKNHFHLYQGIAEAIAEFKPDLLNAEEEHYSLVTWQIFREAKKIGARKMFFAWQNIHKNYPPPFSWVENYIFRNADMAMTGGQLAIDVLRQKGYRGPAQVCPQVGIDTDAFSLDGNAEDRKRELKKQIGYAPNDFLILSAGRIVEEKGVQVTINALKQLSSEKAKLVILGSGPYEGALKELVASDSKLQKTVRFAGAVPSFEMPRYTKAADVMCLSSLTKPHWKEQGPTRVITESMAAQTIAVVSDTVELPIVVQDAGVVVPEGDSAALATALTRLLNEPDLRSKLRQKGLDRVRNHYSARVIAAKNAEIFAAVMAKER
jgi:glycosyltransferase involved in cell wall biosynthesis